MKILQKNLLLILLLSSVAFVQAQTKPSTLATGQQGLIANANSPFMPIKSIGLTDCQWTTGFWADRFNESRDVMVPNLWSLVNNPQISPLWENFLIAAGEKEGEFHGFLFGDGDFYKIVESMCYVYAQTKDPEIDKTMDEIIRVIAKAQRANGYITTGKIIGRGTKMNFDHTKGGAITKEEPFIADYQHEVYNFGHLITLGCIHYRVTGKTTLLEVAIKAADCLYDEFHVPSPELAALHWNNPGIMGLVELYRTTGNKKYLTLAETFINMLGTSKVSASPRGLDHSQKRIPFRKETQAVGHAVHANYLYSGIADVIGEDGDTTLLKPLKSIWNDVTYHKMYLTGATGSHARTASHNGVVGEAYGQEYDLPGTRAYAETCANISNAMWNWRMFLMEGSAEYTDIVERVLYNSALSGISLDGKHFYYQNPLRYEAEYPDIFWDMKSRSSYLNCFCCPPNIVRTIAKVNNYAYSVSDKGVWVNLYGSNSLHTTLPDGSKIALTQHTNYPWEGNIAIELNEVKTKKPFAVMLRIPGWVTEAGLKVNGKNVDANPTPGTYFELNRKWKKGDRIELTLPMKPQLVQAHPFLDDANGQVAILRGPIVYCLEGHDLPKDVKISDVIVPNNIQLKPEYHPDLLNGVSVLKGKVLVKPAQTWNSKLYQPIAPEAPKEIEVQFIPYYAWNNRGTNDMTVWMPLSY